MKFGMEFYNKYPCTIVHGDNHKQCDDANLDLTTNQLTLYLSDQLKIRIKSHNYTNR